MQVSFQVADKTEPSSCKFFPEECIVWTHLKNSERTWDDRSQKMVSEWSVVQRARETQAEFNELRR